MTTDRGTGVPVGVQPRGGRPTGDPPLPPPLRDAKPRIVVGRPEGVHAVVRMLPGRPEDVHDATRVARVRRLFMIVVGL